MAKSALGKGLGALIGPRPASIAPAAPAASSENVETGEKVRQVPISSIVASPLQPRTDFAAEALQELVDSIRQHGIIQPLIVRLVDGKHELIAGERRWRAHSSSALSRRR
jgi:ParB family chromosome partitioning protein